MTASKPIWITESGRLAPGDTATPGAPQGRPIAQAKTASMVTQPLLTWFTANAIPGGSVPYFNAIAWFSTHACGWSRPTPAPDPTPGPSPTPRIQDLTASDLLSIGPVACPISRGWTPPAQQRTVIGELWATATCPLCACPGPDCP